MEQAWYMHPHQEDNLFVLHGTRYVELYMPEHGKVERFTIAPDYIEHNGSASINLATHLEGFDIKTNFNI